jgi:hypothetical protein
MIDDMELLAMISHLAVRYGSRPVMARQIDGKLLLQLADMEDDEFRATFLALMNSKPESTPAVAAPEPEQNQEPEPEPEPTYLPKEKLLALARDCTNRKICMCCRGSKLLIDAFCPACYKQLPKGLQAGLWHSGDDLVVAYYRAYRWLEAHGLVEDQQLED